jgi:hypothetical protein
MRFHRDHMVIDSAYRDQIRRAGLDSVQRVLDALGDEVVAWSRTTDTIRVDLDDCSAWTAAMYVKRYHYHRWRNRLKAMLRGTFFGKHRARAEYDALSVMRKLGIQAVRPIAWGERRCLHFVTRCFLITEAVPDSVSLSTFAISLNGACPAKLPPKQRHGLIADLARKVRRMHDAGFAHGGLFWRNILLRDMADGRYEFHFLDASPGKRVWRKEVFHPDKMEDIAAITTLALTFCTRADRIRFARAYLDVDRVTPQQRAWLAQIDQLAAKYLDHETYRLKMSRLFYRHALNLREPEPLRTCAHHEQESLMTAR